MTTLRTFPRRFVASLRRFLHHWTHRTPKDPPHIAALKKQIAEAERKHKARRHLLKALQEARHARMREIYQ